MKGRIAISRLGWKKDVHFGRVTDGVGLFRQHPRQAFLVELSRATAGLTHANTSCRSALDIVYSISGCKSIGLLWQWLKHPGNGACG
jgi:hypothetical protein